MKRFLAFIACFALMVSLAVPACASDYSMKVGTTLFYGEEQLDNGLTVTREIFENTKARTTYGRTVVYRDTFRDGDTVIAIIAFEATFHYDGTSVSVASKSVIQTDTYNGWNYKQTSFTSSGGTVTLNAKLTKLLIFNNPFTMTLTCDKDGNVSYS